MLRRLEAYTRKALFGVDAETAHNLTIKAMRAGIVLPAPRAHDERLVVEKAGLRFANPFGIAAGFDKNAEVADAALRMGFGFHEVGTITPRPHAGNPKPRVFRLVEEKAVINRLGFNNQGANAALDRLRDRAAKPGLVGVNIGANKDSEDRVADYSSGISRFHSVAGYFTVNVSSPNTPGLRNLQAGDELVQLIDAVLSARDAAKAEDGCTVPVLLKIAPDMTLEQLEQTVGAVRSSGLEGMVVSNTTLDRKLVVGHRNAGEAGGLSGAPLFERSTQMLAQTRRLIGPDALLIGVGGVTDPQTAMAKMEAGADVVQVYSGLIYAGPQLPIDVRKAMARRCDVAGLKSITDITGTRVDEWCAKPLGAPATA
ncbi:MAG: quinone-dependent dihydroorotate dehydrogenase [Pseudomonadota bacterium]